MNPIDLTVPQRASRIKLLISDIDGVLTDGKVCLTADGQEIKFFHIHDGHGIKLLLAAGIQVAVISGRKSQAVTCRMQELGVQYVYQGCADKVPVFHNLMNQLNLNPENVAYVGDDLPDLPVMQQVGLSIAVANAVPLVKSSAHWCTQTPGGMGAIREICDFILLQQNVTALSM